MGVGNAWGVHRTCNADIRSVQIRLLPPKLNLALCSWMGCSICLKSIRFRFEFGWSHQKFMTYKKHFQKSSLTGIYSYRVSSSGKMSYLRSQLENTYSFSGDQSKVCSW